MKQYCPTQIVEKKPKVEKLVQIQMGGITGSSQNSHCNQNYSHNTTTRNSHNTTTHHENSHNTQINNHITINAFGEEDLSYISNTVLQKAVESGQFCVRELLKEMNFNRLKPQNHNMYGRGITSKYINIFNGESWEDIEAELACEKKSKQIVGMIKDNIKNLEEGAKGTFGATRMLEDYDRRGSGFVNQQVHDTATSYNYTLCVKKTRRVQERNLLA